MIAKSHYLKLLPALAALLWITFPNQAQTPARPSGEQLTAAGKYFPDTELVTQDGKTVRFYTDVLKGKVVAINCFFATCQGSCLPMNRNFEKVQNLLGDRVGKDVFLISITVDPEMDTPAELKKYAARHRAGPGWIFLTGQKANVELIQKKLGQYVADKNQHNNIMIVGNEPTGLWKKVFGLSKAEDILKVIEGVIADKANGSP